MGDSSILGYLLFAAPALRALLATWGRDDLAAPLPACVVRGFLLFFCCLLHWLSVDSRMGYSKWIDEIFIL